MMLEPYAQIALLLAVTAGAGAISLALRQPVLIAYIVVGIAVGPSGFAVVEAHDQVDLLAQVGITVLLFLVGLKLDLGHVRHIGGVAVATGLGQLGFTIVFGFALTMLIGKDWITALYIAVALTFSSTIIIVKLLSDKRELDSLHGRIAVGFLIVQDIAVVLAMMGMSAMRRAPSGGEQPGVLNVLGSLALRMGVTAVLVVVSMRWVLPRVVRTMARSQELLLVFAIAWGTALSASGEAFGFSKEAGAFLAGFTLASSGYRDAINARLTGLRDFLLLFFFIDLGAKIELSTLGSEIGSSIALSLFVLVGNPLIVMAIMGFMGYRRRTGFMAGLTVAQISEFSIVFIAMGITLGHVGRDALGLTTLVGLVTITVSTYMILYSQALFERVGPWLKFFERKAPTREREVDHVDGASQSPQVVIFGLGRYGTRLLERLESAGTRCLGVDFDPENVRAIAARGFTVRFGDAEDPALLESLSLGSAAWAVSTLPEVAPNRALLHALGEVGFRGRIAAVVRDVETHELFDEVNAPMVFHPYDDAADLAATRLVEALVEPS